MKTFKQFINEMATPRIEDKAKVYYHGTTTEKAAISICQNGLDASHTEIKYGEKESSFKPQLNRVYITPDLTYAMIYGIGGDMAGHDVTRDIPKLGQYGFVFEFPGKVLKDIVPDEDSIGEFLCRWWYIGDYYKKLYPEFFAKAKENGAMAELSKLADKHLTTPQIKRIQDGESEYWAKGGKRLMPYISDELKLKLIDLGAHVAHAGKLKPSRCYRFDRADVVKMNKDGSNFFKFAKKWKPE